NGHGGWPMTVFLTPQQKPFYAGTYFPPEERQGYPGFPTVLRALGDAWLRDRQGLELQATNLTAHLARTENEDRIRSVSPTELRQARDQLEQAFDGIHGGFGPAPKFPAAAAISLLLRRYRSDGDDHALHMATHTLDRMALGGLYDHLGGGFARYSTDEKWLVPHFEKMLYDNALLVRTYCEAWLVTQSPLYERVVRETLDFVIRELRQSNGGFASALDADTEGEEGLFYVWDLDEVTSVLGEEDGAIFTKAYGISSAGNWEGHNVLHLEQSLEETARAAGDTEVQGFIDRIDTMRTKLNAVRETRTKPAVDDKVLTSWNAMMIGAMALGFRVTADVRYLDVAIAAADFIDTSLTRDGRLLRTYREGQAHLNAYLEDYAHLAEALIELYEVSGEGRFLARATAIADTMLSRFGTSEGGAFYTTANDHETLIIRKREGYDGATPSPNAVAACALVRLAAHLGRNDLQNAALSAIEAWGHAVVEMPRAFCKLLQAVDFVLEGPTQIAITGVHPPLERNSLQHAALTSFTPNAVIAYEHAVHGEASSYENHPLLEGKRGDVAPRIHVCRDFTCKAPQTTAQAVREALEAARPERSPTLRRPLPGHATPDATRQKAQQAFDSNAINTLGQTNLSVTPVSFGSYRLIDEVPAHEEALELALSEGINLIDTSTTYTDGRSERLIGRVLRKLIHREQLERSQVVVVSKIGYLQGENLRNAVAREPSYEDVVEYHEELWHCIHPNLLQEHLTASLQRLGLETLDVCLLHNPEYFLIHTERVGGGTRPALEAEMQRRIEEAFKQFELERKNGRIRFYGVSSNTFVDKQASFTTLSVSALMEIAHRVGGEEHGFRVIQLPMNLLEAGATASRNTGVNNAETPLEYAKSQDLGVLINRPLNAIVEGNLVRLATPTVPTSDLDYASALSALNSVEQELRTRLTGEAYIQGEAFKFEEFFYFAVEFENYGNQSHNATSWSEIEYRVINKRLNGMVEFMQRNLQGNAAKVWQSLFPSYQRALGDAAKALRERALNKSLTQANQVSTAIAELIPSARQDAPLSQKAIWLTHNVQGVSTVLCGMRSADYVRDILALGGWPSQPTSIEDLQEVLAVRAKIS
ncbi:MAG: aldo/keto reductase, partial [Myxococcota bacterium]|nr:aldo/keto reductase [Myxococcota bacterium]